MRSRSRTGTVPQSLADLPRVSGLASLYLSLVALLVPNLCGPVYGKPVQKAAIPERPREIHESPVITGELLDVVKAYIAAGDNNDPAARGKYLAPKVFYYGHARTREQAIREIASLYRRWPERKFFPTDSIELFKIPEHREAYRVTALYEYKFDNMDEHLSGMSELTCVVEHAAEGVRIIGVDEKLVNTSTHYQRD
ncbi:MAG TPA: hypothetical protein VE154_04455 [Chthoniobacterales bacterium]|nr:hypothetical protein [Chthoniobacterales bacterium]